LKIKRIKLKNIRSHEDSEIEFHKGINVFTGRTGSGKSTILLAIEYGLFGSDAGISSSAILRRGKPSGYIEIELEEKGDTYKIVRGLKRKGKTISIDPSKMAIYKNEKLLPIIGRAGDLNARVLDILNYPEGIKPKEIFEITSYTKQDEIRALIELRPEKRQDYIDKILQLSKYKTTWENMRDIISHFEMKLQEIKGFIDGLKDIGNEKKEIEEKIGALKDIIKGINEELNSLRTKSIDATKEVKELELERNEILAKRRSYDELKGRILSLEKENKNIEKEINNLEDEISEIKPRIKENHLDYDKIKEKLMDLKNLINLNKEKLSDVSIEIEKIQNLGEGKCPVCKQPVTKKHLENVNKEFEKAKKEIENKIKELEGDYKKLEPKLKAAEETKKLEEKYTLLNEKLKDYQNRLTRNNEEIVDLNSKLTSYEFDNKKLNMLEEELQEKKKIETELISKITALSREHTLRKSELQEKANELMKINDEIKKLNESAERMKHLEFIINILSKLRNDIRNIREVVRRNFLEDFRQEFQKKFEEIRKFEEEYSVDIKNDYEPVTYSSSGEEVPISNLSGGEKTSIALAYRLALADIAAQISDITPSEILILDEPTTGFDKEDVKALPEALRNIKTIPQIIIVTHEEELKNAGDYKFEVSKEFGKSIINEI